MQRNKAVVLNWFRLQTQTGSKMLQALYFKLTTHQLKTTKIKCVKTPIVVYKQRRRGNASQFLS